MPPSSAFKMPKGPQLTAEQQEIWYWIDYGLKELQQRLGEERYEQVKLASIAAVSLFALFAVVKTVLFFLRDPTKGVQLSSAGSKKKHKTTKDAQPGVKKKQGSPEESSTPTEAEPPAPTDAKKEVESDLIVLRNRPSSVAEPSSSIKGFQRCLAATSPAANCTVLSCTKSRKLHVHPAHYFRPHLGKELSQKGFFELDTDLGEKPMVTAIGFSDNGEYMVLGESNADTFYVFAVDAKGKHASLRWSQKMPNRRLVSVFDQVAVDATGHYIMCFTNKNCEVEVIQRHQGPSGKERFKIGDATCWAHGAGYVAAAGSYMTDIRVGKIQVRPDGKSVSLERDFMVKSSEKITAMAMTTAGAPENSAASLLVAMTTSGVCKVYNLTGVRASMGEEPQQIGEFKDDDYALNPTAKAGCCRGVAVALTGNPYHEVLHVALWNATDIAYYRQVGTGHEKKMELHHVQDLHSVHDGEAIKNVQFIHSATGLVTTSVESGRGPRLWTLKAAQ